MRLDMLKLSRDTKTYLESLLRKKRRPAQFIITINGFDAGDAHETLEEFNRYLEGELLPRLNDAEFDFKKWGKKVFGLKMVYNGGKGGKPMDFETGSIFEEDSKRVYGKKKYLNRKFYTKKKGNQKGK